MASFRNRCLAIKRSFSSSALVKNVTHKDPDAASKSAQFVEEYLPYMLATYSRPLPVFQKGEGSILIDIEGRKYIDFTAGIAVNSLGHCDPEVSAVIAKQASTLVHASNLYHNDKTGPLCKKLVEVTRKSGTDMSHAFICNSGTEANEAALKFARKVGKLTSEDKVELVSFKNSFHGRTMGALSVTPNLKYQAPFLPMVGAVKYGDYNNADQLAELITDKTCGVIVEPVQGEGGVNVGHSDFFKALRNRCNETGAVLIYDEIQSGVSRTGTFWAHQAFGVDAHPDIITMAKALGNGFPIGGVLVNNMVSDAIKVGDHGTTFGGNPLACAVADHVLDRVTAEDFLEGVNERSWMFVEELERLKSKYSNMITEVRGRGLFLGLQLNRDPADIITAARERGLLIITAGTNTLRFLPPLNIEKSLIKEGLEILDEALSVV
ncbi:hypothetical protein CANCADRAFT_2505 [Tortispora caseinolytica NRRL Y-17796]|uniref:Acetylornithine aminotransferase, mitochondrial n=1 Tax=Tortispora caseinolytica NRRL Y-17796 TaxID=767744 RepID=A0A1E4TGD1_9ASCO|nr:hypothetical protein CANCADRAFT_2505 [Tortispora caseinolytica NRRL Y-17796]